MTSRSIFFFALMFAALPAAAARKSVPLDAGRLLVGALSVPTTTYAMKVRLQVFPRAGSPAPGKPRAQYRLILFAPPSSTRVEIARKPKGPFVMLETEKDGSRALVWPREDRAWLFPISGIDPRVEAARLAELYDVSASTAGRVAKRTTVRLDLRSKQDGRLRRSYWLDRKSGIVLRREDYRPDGEIQRRERALRLTFGEEVPAGAFVPVFSAGKLGGPGRPGGLDDPYESSERGLPPPPPEGFVLRRPRWIPSGYMPFAAFGGSGVLKAVLSFNDGVKPFQVAQGEPGSLGPSPGKSYGKAKLSVATAILSQTEDGLVVSWSEGGRDYLVSGDIPEADLLRIADSLGEAP